MAHPEVSGKKMSTGPALALDANADAYTIEEFCRRHRISTQLFYKLRDQMPDTFNVGSRVLISREAAERWRRAREGSVTADRKSGSR